MSIGRLLVQKRNARGSRSKKPEQMPKDCREIDDGAIGLSRAERGVEISAATQDPAFRQRPRLHGFR